MDSLCETPPRENSRELILKSAREAIRTNGILGIRVADIAKRANYSVSGIYRHFGDKDGLIAQVLGDVYEEILDGVVARMNQRFPGDAPLTVDDIVDALPSIEEIQDSDVTKFRLQILAVASINPQLRERVAAASLKSRREWVDLIAKVRSRLVEGEFFDDRVFLIMLVNQMSFYNALLGEHGTTDREYRQFLRDKLRIG